LARWPWTTTLVALLAVLVTLLAGALIGAADIGPGDLLALVTSFLSTPGSTGVDPGTAVSEHADETMMILREIRLPRLAAAAFAGAVMAGAGVLAQGYFRNPLASPGVLGLESAAALGAALAFYAGGAALPTGVVPAAALAGVFLATLLILSIASRIRHWSVETLLIGGFALTAILSALTTLVVTLVLEEHQRASAILQWLMGSFSGKGFAEILPALPLALVGIFLALRLTTRLDVLALGEDIAATSGVAMETLRRSLIIAIALLVAAAVTVAGALPFVSLIVPLAVRLQSGPQHRPLFVHSMLFGAALVMLADTAARTIRAPAEVEVGLVTALIGAPIFLALVLQRTGVAGSSR